MVNQHALDQGDNRQKKLKTRSNYGTYPDSRVRTEKGELNTLPQMMINSRVVVSKVITEEGKLKALSNYDKQTRCRVITDKEP